MSLAPRLEIRHAQSLVMTPQLRQAIKLLQCSNLDVTAFVEQELERNPLLERDDGPDPVAEIAPEPVAAASPEADATELLRDGTLPAEPPVEADFSDRFEDGAMPARGTAGFDADERGIDDFVEATKSLREHLREQLRLEFADPADRLIGAQFIALLDPAGRVPVATEALAAALGADPARVASVRARMQRFDPTGLFAVDLRDCLAAQLAEKNRLDPAMAALLDNLDLLARRDMRGLAAVCGVDAEDLADMIAELRALDPKPGASHDDAPAQLVVPDILMRAGPEGDWLIELNPDTMPRLHQD